MREPKTALAAGVEALVPLPASTEDNAPTQYKVVPSEPDDPPGSVRAAATDGSVHIFSNVTVTAAPYSGTELKDGRLDLKFSRVRNGP